MHRPAQSACAAPIAIVASVHLLKDYVCQNLCSQPAPRLWQMAACGGPAFARGPIQAASGDSLAMKESLSDPGRELASEALVETVPPSLLEPEDSAVASAVASRTAGASPPSCHFLRLLRSEKLQLESQALGHVLPL